MLGVGKTIDKKVWDEIVNEVDCDGNGDIDFEEFSQMMHSLLKQEVPEEGEGPEESSGDE